MDEREKAAVSALLEDFKARWQELLNFENENNRWSTLYVTALILVISWLLNNERYQGLEDLFHRGQNSYFIVSLALINAIYTLAMALKSYQIQQIALYLYGEIGLRVAELTRQPFNSWERWRREAFQSEGRKGRPQIILVFYYVTISTLPAVVSFTILSLYAVYEWGRHRWYHGPNVYFYVVCAAVFGMLAAALSTTRVNKKWEERLRQLYPAQDKIPAEAAEESKVGRDSSLQLDTGRDSQQPRADALVQHRRGTRAARRRRDRREP